MLYLFIDWVIYAQEWSFWFFTCSVIWATGSDQAQSNGCVTWVMVLPSLGFTVLFCRLGRAVPITEMVVGFIV